jgi:hypothetical protein
VVALAVAGNRSYLIDFIGAATVTRTPDPLITNEDGQDRRDIGDVLIGLRLLRQNIEKELSAHVNIVLDHDYTIYCCAVTTWPPTTTDVSSAMQSSMLSPWQLLPRDR